jgi:hypothetical protein
MTKQRSDRLAKQRERGSKRSYVTEIEDLRIMLAWEAGVLSEGQAAKALGYDRVTLRDLKNQTLHDAHIWYLTTRQA